MKCLLEIGLPTLKQRIRSTQKKFISKLVQERATVPGDPFYHVWMLCKSAKTKSFLYLDKVCKESDRDHMIDIKSCVQLEAVSKFVSYRTEINPDLLIHNVYTDRLSTLSEHQRIDFTRLRTSSHNLAIETGRWTRPITPREARICSCGEVQSEAHVILNCPQSDHIRQANPGVSFVSLKDFFCKTDIVTMVKISSDILKTYDHR